MWKCENTSTCSHILPLTQARTPFFVHNCWNYIQLFGIFPFSCLFILNIDMAGVTDMTMEMERYERWKSQHTEYAEKCTHNLLHRLDVRRRVRNFACSRRYACSWERRVLDANNVHGSALAFSGKMCSWMPMKNDARKYVLAVSESAAWRNVRIIWGKCAFCTLIRSISSWQCVW